MQEVAARGPGELPLIHLVWPFPGQRGQMVVRGGTIDWPWARADAQVDAQNQLNDTLQGVRKLLKTRRTSRLHCTSWG